MRQHFNIGVMEFTVNTTMIRLTLYARVVRINTIMQAEIKVLL